MVIAGTGFAFFSMSFGLHGFQLQGCVENIISLVYKVLENISAALAE